MHADRVQFDIGGAGQDKVVVHTVVTLASATNGGLWLVSWWYFHRLDFFESGIVYWTNEPGLGHEACSWDSECSELIDV